VVASEVICAAASVEKARELLSPVMVSGSIQSLLTSDDKDISSGVASAFAKLGLSNKNFSSDDGEIFALLEVAATLLDDKEIGSTNMNNSSLDNCMNGRQSTATSSAIERGIEVLSYLSSKTIAKEEIAHGYKAPSSQKSVLERLVELSTCNLSGTVEAFGLASIYSALVVSNETLRKEAFIGQEITAEQYDQLQALGKTEEEKELEKSKADIDPSEAVRERIRKLVNKNVPRAMIVLLDNATETTQEQLALGMTRMAEEESARGAMIQQGVLSAFIKMVKKVRFSCCNFYADNVRTYVSSINEWVFVSTLVNPW